MYTVATAFGLTVPNYPTLPYMYMPCVSAMKFQMSPSLVPELRKKGVWNSDTEKDQLRFERWL